MFNFIKELFQKQQVAKIPFVQEIIERSESEQIAYQTWKVDDKKDEIISFLLQQIEVQSNSDLLRLNSPKSQGFILKHESVAAMADFAEFRHLFDYLKEQVLKLNYVSYVSDVKNFVRKTHVETIERHYMKPRFSYDEETRLSNQQYGNILIEHLLHDEKSIRIKFVCNVYNDRKWTEPLQFSELLEQVLS